MHGLSKLIRPEMVHPRYAHQYKKHKAEVGPTESIFAGCRPRIRGICLYQTRRTRRREGYVDSFEKLTQTPGCSFRRNLSGRGRHCQVCRHDSLSVGGSLDLYQMRGREARNIDIYELSEQVNVLSACSAVKAWLPWKYLGLFVGSDRRWEMHLKRRSDHSHSNTRVPDSSINMTKARQRWGMSSVKESQSSERSGWSGLRVGLATCRYMITHAVRPLCSCTPVTPTAVIHCCRLDRTCTYPCDRSAARARQRDRSPGRTTQCCATLGDYWIGPGIRALAARLGSVECRDSGCRPRRSLFLGISIRGFPSNLEAF